MASVSNLKTKTSTCTRLVKELHSYEKEVEREATKTVAMKDKGADPIPYDLKQLENVLVESRIMIPDCWKRLDVALADLKIGMTKFSTDTEIRKDPFHLK
ncbi:hypothetical protein LWI28_028369 [Acer negundo]|uniref:Tubulin-specific chaperone A n=1 Tax=Acer negundo TaxID=4023 RepID=A0AAD5P2A1_ACENE|nr:hypothetical protein LWI28_028369 [Acer negundo]